MTNLTQKPSKPGLFRRALRAETRFFAPFIEAGQHTQRQVYKMVGTVFSRRGPQQYPTMRIPASVCYNKMLLSIVLYAILLLAVLYTHDDELAFLLVPASLPLAIGLIGLIFGRRPGVF